MGHQTAHQRGGRFKRLGAMSLFAGAMLLLACPCRAEEGQAHGRIIDGTNVPVSQFPAVAQVGDILSGTPVYYGSGTLISNKHVLTAGHVVTDEAGIPAIPPAGGVVKIGGVVRTTSKITVHPTFKGYDSFLTEGDYDIAILELSTPVTGITPAPLYRQAPAAGTVLTIAGFGLVGEGRFGAGVDSDVPPDGTLEYGTTPLETVTPTFLKWVFDNVPPPNQESNTSPGDSGGPAFITVNSVLYVAGVTSGGSSASSSFGDRSFDTRVDAVAAWIDRVLNNQAPNDLFADAAPVYGTRTLLTASNAGASKEAGEPAHASNAGGASLWWKWTAPASGVLTLSTAGSDFDTVLALYAGPALNSLAVVGSNDDIDPAAVPPQKASALTANVVAGKTYHIAVDGANGATGQIALSLSLAGGADLVVSQIEMVPANPVPGEDVEFTVTVYNQGAAFARCYVGFWSNLDPAPDLSRVPEQTDYAEVDAGGKAFLSFVAPAPAKPQATAWAYADMYLGISQVPESNEDNNAASLPYYVVATAPNDNFANATEIPSGDASVTCGNGAATLEPGEPRHAGRPGGRSVWWKWTALGSGTTLITTDGSTFDTVLAVYTGSSIETLKEAASNDDHDGWVNSLVTFKAIAGHVYYIAVDGLNGAYGRIDLSISGGSPLDLMLKRAQLRFDFKESAKDSVSLSGQMQLQMPLSFAHKNTASVYIGDFQKDFTLDARGQSSDKAFRISVNSRTGTARFTLNLRDADLFGPLQNLGFVNADVKDMPVVLPVVVAINDDGYSTTTMVTYKAKAGVGGQAK